MDVTARSAAADVAGLEPVLGNARRYSFFQLVDLIHRHHGDDLERGGHDEPRQERIRFSLVRQAILGETAAGWT